MPATRDEIVGEIAKGSRNDSDNRSQDPPSASEPPQNVNEGIGADEQRARGGFGGHAIGQRGALVNRNARLESHALQRCESERRACGIVLENKLHAAMAEPAVSVVIQDFGWLLRAHVQFNSTAR